MTATPKPAPTAGPLHVLFVCTANICRSPYAELRSRTLWAGSQVTASSAGVRGFRDRPMDRVMAAELRRRGGDARTFRSHPIDLDDLDRADLVVTFEFSQQMWLWEHAPESRTKIFGLTQLAGAVETAGNLNSTTVPELHRSAPTNSMTDDVDDPYKRGPKQAARCADHIDALLSRIARALPAA